MDRRWRTSGACPALWVTLTLIVAATAHGEPAGGAGAEPLFVRGGILLPAVPAAASDVRVGGALVLTEPLGAGRLLVPYPWKPREAVTLGWREGERIRRLDLKAPLRPTPWVRWAREWPPAGLLTAGEEPVTALAFSPDGRRLAAGTQAGRVAVFDAGDGRTLWTMQRPERVIKHLAFSPAGARLYVGEQGAEGRLAAYDLARGSAEPLWSLDTATDLDRSPPGDPRDPYAWVQQPGAYRLEPLGDDVLAAFTHSWVRQGRRVARARLYRVDGRTGEPRWAWPRAGAAPQMMTWFDSDPAAPAIALPLHPPAGAGADPSGGPGDGAGGARIVVLRADTGEAVFSDPVAPRPPYAGVEFWRGVAFRPGGRGFAATTEDGRGFLYERGRAGWQRLLTLELVPPLRLAGATIAATNGTLAATADEAIFASGSSYVPLVFGGGEPRAAHPGGNTLYGYSWLGDPRWLWRLDNDLQGLALSADGATLALLQGRETPQPRDAFNGVAVLDLRVPGSGREKLRYRFPLAGRVVFDGVALAADGRWLALAEAPRRIAGDARPQGGARVLMLR